MSAMNPIPVFNPSTGTDTTEAVVAALADGWLGMGKLTQQFQAEISDFLGSLGTPGRSGKHRNLSLAYCAATGGRGAGR